MNSLPGDEGLPPSMIPDSSTTTRALAWARAYLEAQNTTAAKMCLSRVMKLTGPADMKDHGLGAVQLAADIATQYIVGGNVDEAAEFLGFAASWTRGEPETRPAAEEEERTVVIRSPVARHPVPKPPPRLEPAHDQPTQPGAGGRGRETSVGRFEDDVTRIYRPGQSCSASGTVVTNTIRRVRPDARKIT